jgi:serine/threonine protein kinase
VAVKKIITPVNADGDDNALARIYEEVRIMEALTDKNLANVVNIHNYCGFEENLSHHIYIVMDLCE